MFLNANRSNTNKSRAVANNVSKQTETSDSESFLHDNRESTCYAFQLQKMLNASPQVSRQKTYQSMVDSIISDKRLKSPIQKKPNNTGLPNNLKSGIERISGYSMDDVKVHYNSDKPIQMKAFAFAQGNSIHIAPGQDHYLAHEAWHVVQQKQGRVIPSIQMKDGTEINNDLGLEQEADEMGTKAAFLEGSDERDEPAALKVSSLPTTSLMPVQRMLVKGMLNVAGETHGEIDKKQEKLFAFEKTGGSLFMEHELKWINERNEEVHGDDKILRFRFLFDRHISRVIDHEIYLERPQSYAFLKQTMDYLSERVSAEANSHKIIYGTSTDDEKRIFDGHYAPTFILWEKYILEVKKAKDEFESIPLNEDGLEEKRGKLTNLITAVKLIQSQVEVITGPLLGANDDKRAELRSTGERELRSGQMHEAAQSEAFNQPGIWKVGNNHVIDILADRSIDKSTLRYNLLTKDSYLKQFEDWETDKYLEDLQKNYGATDEDGSSK